MVDLRRHRARWYFPGVAGTFIVGVATYLLLAGGPITIPPTGSESTWAQHQIVVGAAGTGFPDGADGVGLADVDGDGLQDVVSGHEQGLRLTLSFNPGPAAVESPWPTVTLPAAGNLCAAEDVQFGDVNADGALDMVAACETGAFRVAIFFAPAPPNTRSELLTAANWTQVNVDAADGLRSMRVQVVDIAGDSAPELLVGGKESSGPCVAANVVYYSSATPTVAASWTSTTLAPAGWVKEMIALDFDGDTDLDVVYSDGDTIDCNPGTDNTKRGVRWLRNDGGGTFVPIQIVNEVDHQWFGLSDLDGDTDLDVLTCKGAAGPPATTNLVWRINASAGTSWSTFALPTIPRVGMCIHPNLADVNDDDLMDITLSSAHSQSVSGMVVLERSGGGAATPTYTRREVSGSLDSDSDVKFDSNYCSYDIDGDGDLDCFTTEQHVPSGNGPGRGVLYFENPLLTFVAPPPASSIECTVLESSSTSTDGTSVVTGSVSPPGNNLILAFVTSCNAGGPNTATATGNGLTWDLVTTVSSSTGNGRKVTVRRALGATPSAGAVTFDFAGQTQTCFAWSIVACSNVDTSGSNGAGAVVQSVTATSGASDVTTLSATLAAFGSASNRSIAAVGLDVQTGVSPDPDWTELSDVSVASGSATLEIQTDDDQVQIDPTFSSASAGIVAIEVKAAP